MKYKQTNKYICICNKCLRLMEKSEARQTQIVCDLKEELKRSDCE